MIWLIGSGSMSIEYSKVLDGLNKQYTVVGRGQASADTFFEATGKPVVTGGLEAFIKSSASVPEAAIISVGVYQLYDTALQLIEFGVKNILIEKPAAVSYQQVEDLCARCVAYNSNIYVAYNRRFFSSVLEAKKRIAEEGGPTSFNFELTEWAHLIEKIDKPLDVLRKWFLANSTHVADLAFFLGGKPKMLTCFTSGSLEWHPDASIFAGAGVSQSGALFNYAANWESAGRWSVEVLTKDHRYIFRPMEQLQVQKRGQIAVNLVEVDDSLDKEYKPGLYKQVKAFLMQDCEHLCSLAEQKKQFKSFEKMAGYER
ncbi:Gfo/Idh/MocA family oxidoreductase [Paraperlucidibaca wandonensis]|uniref:Gfo/Idh/MocA family oxidoreductase n=1 Tax=Paraperlucidibaca wandonensis TaxID=1268273 RepID=A0ABW3HI61_9GAMM